MGAQPKIGWTTALSLPEPLQWTQGIVCHQGGVPQPAANRARARQHAKKRNLNPLLIREIHAEIGYRVRERRCLDCRLVPLGAPTGNASGLAGARWSKSWS